MGEGQTIAYISDVGAQSLKPLFIAGSCVTTVFLDLSFLSERWLRHRGRLAANLTVTEQVLSRLSLAFAILGTAGLILLSIFDTLHHPTLHDVFLLLFIVGYVVSAIFICWEYQRLGIRTFPYPLPSQSQLQSKLIVRKDFRQHMILRASFWIKLSFILIEIALAIAFAICNFRNADNAAAVLEWAIAFIFTLYVFSFFIDLLPAVHTKHSGRKFGSGADETEMQQEQNDGDSQGMKDAYAGRPTADSQRTLAQNDERTVNGVRYKDGGACGK
jgi:hypothetical protein